LFGIGGSYTNGRLSLDGLDEHTSFAAPRGWPTSATRARIGQ